MLVAFTALCAAAASPHSGLVSPRPALLRLSGGATAAAQPAVAVADPQPGKPHEQQKAARRHKWRGSVLVISLLYSVALVNGFVRRTLSCASPLQERSGWLPREQIEEISMLGYQSFAAGRALAAPFIVRLGAKRALLLQLTVLASACVAICVTPHASALRVQTVSWALVRVFSAMTVTLMLPFVRTWVPRDAYGRVWGLLQSGVQTVSAATRAAIGHSGDACRPTLSPHTVPHTVLLQRSLSHDALCVCNTGRAPGLPLLRSAAEDGDDGLVASAVCAGSGALRADAHCVCVDAARRQRRTRQALSRRRRRCCKGRRDRGGRGCRRRRQQDSNRNTAGSIAQDIVQGRGCHSEAAASSAATAATAADAHALGFAAAQVCRQAAVLADAAGGGLLHALVRVWHVRDALPQTAPCAARPAARPPLSSPVTRRAEIHQ